MNAYLRRKQRAAKLASERGKVYRAKKKAELNEEVLSEKHALLIFANSVEIRKADAVLHERELNNETR